VQCVGPIWGQKQAQFVIKLCRCFRRTGKLQRVIQDFPTGQSNCPEIRTKSSSTGDCRVRAYFIGLLCEAASGGRTHVEAVGDICEPYSEPSDTDSPRLLLPLVKWVFSGHICRIEGSRTRRYFANSPLRWLSEIFVSHIQSHLTQIIREYYRRWFNGFSRVRQYTMTATLESRSDALRCVERDVRFSHRA
jgi:hypothetical protein